MPRWVGFLLLSRLEGQQGPTTHSRHISGPQKPSTRSSALSRTFRHRLKDFQGPCLFKGLSWPCLENLEKNQWLSRTHKSPEFTTQCHWQYRYTAIHSLHCSQWHDRVNCQSNQLLATILKSVYERTVTLSCTRSHAIAKVTTWCAQYMSALKIVHNRKISRRLCKNLHITMLSLFGGEIIIEEFQPLWSWYLIVTDGQADDTQSRNRALCSIAQ